MLFATEHLEPHTQQWCQLICDSFSHTPDTDTWPENNLCDDYQLSVPVSRANPNEYSDPTLPAFEPAIDEVYHASWGQVESETAFWATDHPTVLPIVCRCEVDDMFEGLPLVVSEPLTSHESYTQMTDTSGRVRSDEQGHYTVDPRVLVLSNLQPESSRPHPGSSLVDLLMQALEASSTSSTENDNDGNEKTRKYRCPIPICNKSFGQPAHLKVHMRSHTDERPYPCHIPGCISAFAQPGNLKTHELRHRGEKPRTRPCSPAKRYTCILDKCQQADNGRGKKFTLLGSLKKHMNKFHGDTLRQLYAIFTGQSWTCSQKELDLSDYFRLLYNKCNKKADKASSQGSSSLSASKSQGRPVLRYLESK